ncbi:MAG: imidazoleglycerol-phosphate dehydratase [Candidatus Obscuribacterales bacterium]|nr:imidazoleglycerol-phosphate dehydratase [Candidatus Obscuribacterales bacterium]
MAKTNELTVEAVVGRRQRRAMVKRATKETNIVMEVDFEESLRRVIQTSIPFLDHMLDALACHGRFGLVVTANGDIDVDPHHLVEDCGIVLGETIYQALGSLKGIERAGSFSYPMDGTLVNVAIDICGRRNLVWNISFGNFTIGTLDPNLFREFFKGLVDGMRSTVHVNCFYKDNDHHAIEATFKAFGRALKDSVRRLETDEYVSTKGVLDEN